MSKRTMTVSVVIPTIGRPELGRAIDSALRQTLGVTEVLVVLDAAGDLDVPIDPRVRILRVGPAAGGNAARQAGITESRGELVALLDDDDEWLPNHIETLLHEVTKLPAGVGQNWVASSRAIARRTDGTESIWPAELKQPSQSLAQYIFRKNKIRGGIGFMQASCLLFPRSLALHIPFDASLRFHQDVGWLNELSSAKTPISVVQSVAATTIHYIGDSGVAKSITSDLSVKWALKHLNPDDKRSLGDFICVHSLQAAKNNGTVHEMLRTLVTANRVGRPGLAANAYGIALTVQKLLSRR